MTRNVIATALATALSLPAMAQGEGREIKGALTYLPRIALPAEAEVVVAVDGIFGARLGEMRFATVGAQVPLPFSVQVPAGLNGSLGALVQVGETPLWIAQDIPLAAGSDGVDLGMIEMQRFTPLSVAVSFDCGGQPVEFGVAGDAAMLLVGEQTYDMVPAMSASGARYVAVGDESTEFWSKGDEAMLKVAGQEMGACIRVDAGSDPYRARGNEPGWVVTLGEAEVEISADYGAMTLTAPRPEPQVVTGGYIFDMPEIEARLTLEDQLCADDATGMPYPHRATLALDSRELKGCGGDPASLLTGTEWSIVDIAGDLPVEDAETMIGFAADGRAFGSTGCNRFFGGYTLTGEGLSMGPMGATMMACPEPLMAQERAVLDALAAVRRFSFAEDGALLLIGGPEDAPLITARRM